MKQKLNDIGQKIASLINAKLQEPQLSKDDYLLLLQKIELMVDKEYKILMNEIIEAEIK